MWRALLRSFDSGWFRGIVVPGSQIILWVVFCISGSVEDNRHEIASDDHRAFCGLLGGWTKPSKKWFQMWSSRKVHKSIQIPLSSPWGYVLSYRVLPLFAGARGRSSTKMPCLLILIQCQVASDGNAAHICSPIHFSLHTDCWLCAKSATIKNRFPSDGGTSCSLVDSMKMQFLKMWWRRFFPLEQRFDIDDLIYCWIFTLQGQLVGWLWDNRWSAATAWKSQVFF